MKRIIASVLIATTLAGCGAPIDYNGKHYPTYGFFNESTERSEKMCYKLSVGNVVLSIVFVQTIIAPIYFIGFSLFNPTGPKNENGCGIDAK